MSRRKRNQRRIERLEERSEARQVMAAFESMLGELVPTMIDMGDHLTQTDDPFEAECVGGGTLLPLLATDMFAKAGVARRLAEALAAEGGPAALAVLRLMTELDTDWRVSFAAELADGVAAAGASEPPWVGSLRAPVEAVEFLRYTAAEEPSLAMVLAGFRREGEVHGFSVGVDLADCGAADLVEPISAADYDEVLTMVEAQFSTGASGWAMERLDHEEAGRFLTGALQAALEHFAEDDEEPDLIDPDEESDEDGPLEKEQIIGLGALLSMRLRAAGLQGPALGHGEHVPAHLREQLAPAQPSIAQMMRMLSGEPGTTPLPPQANRTGPAEVYRLRVDIKGAKPPIWRRLEALGDTTLGGLDDILQIAFDWDGWHLHRFDTAYGDFGDSTQEPSFGDEFQVTIEQVLHAKGDKLTYTYDFGDGWEHTVKVEHVGPPEPGTDYPRCIKAQLAAPPEDCGGIWRYQWLRESLADTAHPDHALAVEFVGEHDRAYYLPEAPDAAELDRRLRADDGTEQ
ncbi:plasmid pRiA4b ORF-3 family protein [Glycomyces salinus]|uniref:plasmid pRiA4b ORF-3 family protein n=1 Tax=Glycomyces salinus TaxID=980294 RepID=UPI0018EE3F0D|nr:plasmid pRiA4b ORF-3 family protein [Glycomyces salinus]